MPVHASLIVSNADWTVDIFSLSTNLVRAFSGTTTNGVIDFDWDGKDTNGVAFAGELIQVEITAIWESEVGLLESGGVTITNKAGKIIYHEGPMPAFPQGFLVSYQLLFPPTSLSASQFANMINQIVLSIEDEGGGTYVLKGDGTGTSGTTKIENTAASWNAWATSLRENVTANLFYFGHGGKDAIGERAKDPNKGFFVKEIQTFLGNEIINKSPEFTFPYRFVFLDGCNSADGNWCIAFGIEQGKVPTAEYTKRGLQPRAFMGWTTVKAYAIAGAFNNEHGKFVINVFSDWATSGEALKTVIDRRIPAGFTRPKIWGDDQLKWLP
jgi:hypothetical protein